MDGSKNWTGSYHSDFCRALSYTTVARDLITHEIDDTLISLLMSLGTVGLVNWSGNRSTEGLESKF